MAGSAVFLAAVQADHFAVVVAAVAGAGVPGAIALELGSLLVRVRLVRVRLIGLVALIRGLILCVSGSSAASSAACILSAGGSRSRCAQAQSTLRSAWPVGGSGRGIRSTGLRSQYDTLDSGRVRGRSNHDVIEMSAVQQFRKHVAGRTGSEVGDHTFTCVRRNIEIRPSSPPDRLEHVCQRGVVSHDGQFAAGVLHTRRYGRYLVEWKRLKRAWSISRERSSRGLVLLFDWFADPTFLGRCKRDQTNRAERISPAGLWRISAKSVTWIPWTSDGEKLPGATPTFR